MIERSHPYHFVSSLFWRDRVFSLGRYRYFPDSISDRREILMISGDQFSEDWLCNEIGKLDNDRELALHSLVMEHGQAWHIPMIDFAMQGEPTMYVIERMNMFLSANIMDKMVFFASGRSFHAYSDALLSKAEWQDFMARLLLVNPKEGEQIVDTRWIGHRLIGGFSALRWTCQSNQYLTIPKRIN